MPYKSVPTTMTISYKKCFTRVSPTRVVDKSVPEECRTTLSDKRSECPTRVLHESFPQEFLQESLTQECSTRESHKTVAYKSVGQVC